ncbi:carboxypeptidase C (cathepsin A) [Nonomuraea thailandensis]|uniref:Carboxypeptidase C (Cathepsin A) n=1 Tax=Nonomuraea thailandensis TaxID=1188745 RepID=A0A9X2GKP8_9ACTN|nr:hypothetical protein [Nonomuraea thailandensis]MCP2359987.1 carboxypeptidase C (cathepsin A) [Nonomuraea thailandensis]
MTHTGVFGGRTMTYTAQARQTTIPGARIVSFDYLAEGPDRPVLFLCNGGPIVPSAFLHMGAFGPRRVAFPYDIHAPTTGVVGNEHCLLDAADLVFYDPPGTGYSRGDTELAGVDEDVDRMVTWVRQWLHDHDRANAPVHLLGESYGTIRVALAARELAEAGVRVDGVSLLGQATNIIETAGRTANILSYVSSLPTLTAVAHYHGKVEGPLEQAVDEVFAFAATDYVTALLRGPALPAQDRDRLAHRLARLTGVPAAVWIERNLRLTKHEFRAELLREDGLVLAMHDGRYAGPPAGSPSPGSIEARMVGPRASGTDTVPQAIDAAIEPHLRDFLKTDLGEEYRRTGGDLEQWRWGPSTSPFADWPYGHALTEAMTLLPGLRVFVGTGMYDLSTTIGAAEHAAAQCGWPPERVRLHRYEGGHLMYSVESTLRRLAADLRAFIGGQA